MITSSSALSKFFDFPIKTILKTMNNCLRYLFSEKCRFPLMSSQNLHQRSISLDFSVSPLMSTGNLFQPFMLVSILWFPSLDYICIRSNSHRKQLYAVNSFGEYVFLFDHDIYNGALKKKDMRVWFSAALTWSFHVRITRKTVDVSCHLQLNIIPWNIFSCV